MRICQVSNFFPATFNIPKFFEFEKVMRKERLDYTTTALNNQKTYIAFCSWWEDLIVIGTVPILALMVFNTRIYLKLRASDRLEFRFDSKNNKAKSPSKAIMNASLAVSGVAFQMSPINRKSDDGEDVASEVAEAAEAESIEVKPAKKGRFFRR